MIIVTGTLTASSEIYDEFLAALKAGIPHALAEEGCIFYKVAAEDAEAGKILICEGWKDEAALAQHLNEPVVAEIIANYGGKHEMDVKIYEVSGVKDIGL